MSKNSAVVSVGLKIDSSEVDKLYNQLRNEFSNIAGSANISDEFKKQFEDVLKTVEELQNKIQHIGQGKVNTQTFEGLRGELTGQIDALERRTSTLEETMRGLLNTLSKDAGSEMASSLKNLMDTMDRTTTTALGMARAISGVTTVVGNNGELHVVDEKQLRKQLDLLNLLKERIQNVGDIDATEYKRPETVKKHLEDAIKEYEGFFKKWSTMTPETEGFDEIQKSLIKSAESLSSILNNAQFDEFKDVDFLNPLIDSAYQSLDRLEEVESSIRGQMQNIGRALKDIPVDEVIGDDKKTAGYKIPIDFSTTSKGLITKLQTILHQVQAAADKEQIKIEFELVSPAQSEKAKTALNKFQQQVNNMTDATSRAEMQGVVDDLRKSLGNSINVNLKTAFDDAAESVRTIIKNLKNELKQANNQIIINPKIEFTKEDIGKLKEQVEDVTKQLTDAMQEAAKSGLFKDENGKKSDAFSDVEKRVKDVIDQLNGIPDTLNNVSLSKLFEDSDGKLNQLIEDLPRLDTFNMGQDSAKALANNLGEARDALKELLSFSTGGKSLEELGNAWKQSDNDMIATYGDWHLRERSAIYTRSGKIYSGYAYGTQDSTGNKYATLKRVKADNEIPYLAIHTHPNTRIPSMSYGSTGDLNSFAQQLKEGITKQATIAATSNIVQVFDSERFYKDYENIDFASLDVRNKIQKAFDTIYDHIGIGKKSGPFLVEMLDELGGGFDNVLEKIFKTAFSTMDDPDSPGSYFEAFRPKFENAIKQIRENFNNITVGNFTGDPIENPMYELLGNLNLVMSKESMDEMVENAKKGALSLKNLFDVAGIPELNNNEDIFQYQIGKMMPYVLEKALGKKNFNAQDFIDNKYVETLSLEEFSDKYGINTDGLSQIFANTGVEQFADNIKSITPALQQISDIFEHLSKLSADGSALNFGIDDASSVAQNIEKICASLSELISLYKQLNSIDGSGIDIPKLSEFLKETLPNGALSDSTRSSFASAFNLDEEDWGWVYDYSRLLRKFAPTENNAGEFYDLWASNIVKNAEEAGIALDNFKIKQQEAQNVKVDFDNDQFDKLVKNTTTLKNSLNSLRKELGDLNISTDLTSITTPLTTLQNTLLEFSEVVQKATGILSTTNLEKEFDKIKESAEKLNGVKFNTKAGKEGAASIISSYKDYLAKGGDRELADIGGSKNLQKYLAKHIDDDANESSAGIDKEAESLKGAGEAAATAAAAKEQFAKANQELLTSIITSISGIDGEGKAFKNLTTMFNSLGGENSTEKMLKVREALNGIVNILKQDVGEASFIKSLESLASTGDALKDLAKVLSATQRQINRAKGATGILSGPPQMDYAQEKFDAESEEILKQGREFFSQYGLVLENQIRKNRDGQLEFVALIKDSQNQLKQYTATYTGSDEQPFKMSNVDVNSPGNLKKALQYERLRRAWESMNGAPNPHETDEIMFDRDADGDVWDVIKEVYESYKSYIGNLQKVTRQVRQGANGELYESFSFIGDQGHFTTGREGDIVASSQSLDDLTAMVSAYEQLYKAAQNFYELKMKVASGTATDYEIRQLQEAERIYTDLLQKTQKMRDEYGNNIVTDAMSKYQNDIGENFDKTLKKRIEGYQKKFEDIKLTRSNQGNQYLPEFQKKLDNVEESWAKLNELRSMHQNGEEWNISELREVNDILQQIDNTYAGLNDKRNIAAKTADIDNLITKLSKLRNDNSLGTDLNNRVNELIEYLQSVRVNGEAAAEAVGKISQKELGNRIGQAKAYTAEAERTGQTGKGFLKQFSGAIKSQSAQFLATYFSLQDFVRYGKEITQTVTSLDSAMVELRKVSGETDQRLDLSFKNSAETAKELGAEITSVINSTADWSRLGYSIDEAEELARVTQIYQNVGDNLTQDTASEYLVSTLQGFHIGAEDALRVVDSINKVANNYAVDTQMIGESLERSAASFNAAGTDLNKSIALVSATAEVTQDAASAGTVWKTDFCFGVQKCASRTHLKPVMPKALLLQCG